VDLTQNDIRGNAPRRLRRARRLSATPLRWPTAPFATSPPSLI